MAQSVAKLLDAPTASPKLQSITTAPKTIHPAGPSFYHALKQVKKKAVPERQTTAKEPPAAKAEPKKSVAPAIPAETAAQSKPASDKTHKSQSATANSKKQPASDQAVDDTQADGDSSDPTKYEALPDAPAKGRGEKAALPTTDNGAAALGAMQLAVASQVAAAASKTPTRGEDSPAKPPADQNGKANPSRDAAAVAAVVGAGNGPGDPAIEAGTMTAQAVTGSDPVQTPATDESTRGKSDNTATSTAVTTPQAVGRGKAKGAQSSKNDNGNDETGADPSSAQLAPLAGSVNANPSADEGDNSQKSPGAATKAVEDVLSKLGMAESMGDAHAPKAIDQTKSTSGSPAISARPEVRFAELNHPTIVSGIHGKLLPDGGAMDIHLSPPDLGAMHVRVEVRDGAVTASFQAADDQTAKLLSHSLSDLKTALEAQGVNVEKLHVSQMPKDQQPTQDGNKNSAQREADRGQQQAAQQEQQRKDMMRRMWRRLMKGQDPLDLVA